MLAFIIRDSLQNEILTEFASARSSSAHATKHIVEALSDPSFLASLPLLDACAQETLRLCTDSMSIRRVEVDEAILREGDHVWRVHRGDIVTCAGRLGQMDENQYEEAFSWKPSRWTVQDSGLTKNMGGRKLMAPFGGGVSMVSSCLT